MRFWLGSQKNEPKMLDNLESWNL